MLVASSAERSPASARRTAASSASFVARIRERTSRAGRPKGIPSARITSTIGDTPQQPATWKSWVQEPRLPQAWPERGAPRDLGDGTALAIAVRTVAFDPLEQILVREMRADLYRDGEVIQSEVHRLDHMIYFNNDILLMLRLAGFGEVEVFDGMTSEAPRPWETTRLMFVAHA